MNNIQNIFQLLKNNPMLNAIRMSKNPMQEMVSIMEKNMDPNNMFMKNVLDIAKNGNNKQAEVIARNLLKEAGVDPDELYKQITTLK